MRAAAQAAALHERLAIGHDYALEEAAGESEPVEAPASTGFVRQPTVAASAVSASSPGPRSAEALGLAAELSAFDFKPPKPAAKKGVQRNKSVSVPQDGARVKLADANREVSLWDRSLWFTDAQRDVIEAAVGSSMHGDFLVRKSGSTSGYVMCVNDHGSPVNYTVDVPRMGVFAFTGAEFSSLELVVGHARKTPLKSITTPGEKLLIASPAVLAPWYPTGSRASRTELERAVKAAGHGSFVVRLSSSKDKFVLVVNDCEDVMSYSITKSDSGRFLFGGAAHDSLPAMIEMLGSAPFLSRNTPELTLSKSAL